MITYDQITSVNKQLKTTPIKGKDYVEVNQRVNAFRQLMPNGRIDTNILHLDGGICVIKATVYDDDGNLLASGIAEEKESSSFINKTSYVENCETSAVGRALGFLGIGIDGSICSAEELTNAINNQNNTQPKGEQPTDWEEKIKIYSEALASNSDMTADDYIAKAKEKRKTAKEQAELMLKWCEQQEERKKKEQNGTDRQDN
nr:MAG TPA: hypothetical protein [Caudoviricetes sp.]